MVSGLLTSSVLLSVSFLFNELLRATFFDESGGVSVLKAGWRIVEVSLFSIESSRAILFDESGGEGDLTIGCGIVKVSFGN
jgi:hypothetical protein